jgi:hypothetical protein
MTYIMVCSLLGGVSVLSIKAVSSFVILTIQGDNQFLTLLPWVTFPILAFTLALQVVIPSLLACFRVGRRLACILCPLCLSRADQLV